MGPAERAVPGPCDLRSRFPKQELKDGWVELLGRWAWEWFATLTFERPRVHPEGADKTFRAWISKVNDARFGRRWRKQGKGVLWARGIEFQRRGSVHFHVLVARVGKVRRLSMMDEWAELAGWARIRPVEHQDRVAKYVAKYVAKGGEIDLGGPGLTEEPLPELW
jgi:hypothetical protein